MPRRLFIGTAGWRIPRASARAFRRRGNAPGALRARSAVRRDQLVVPPAARRAPPTRSGRPSTPRDFRFAVKLPRTITHDLKLRRARLPLERFLEESAGLGQKRGPLLVQLPPSLVVRRAGRGRFFDLAARPSRRARSSASRATRPGFSRGGGTARRHRVARVAADPPPAAGADLPGGWGGLIYFRLHGSPRKYWSRYEPERIAALARASRQVPPRRRAWCIFDNTASGAALENAWELHARMNGESAGDPPVIREERKAQRQDRCRPRAAARLPSSSSRRRAR